MTRAEREQERIREHAAPLFAQAVAQGMHTPFALDCERRGIDWAEKLIDSLYPEKAEE